MLDWPRVGRSPMSFAILIGSLADDRDHSRRAEQEFAESIACYESKEPGLGWRFRNEVAEAVARILRHPELAKLRSKGYRRVNICTLSLTTSPMSFVEIQSGSWRLLTVIVVRSSGLIAFEDEDSRSRRRNRKHAGRGMSPCDAKRSQTGRQAVRFPKRCAADTAAATTMRGFNVSCIRKNRGGE
jgi:hypothetical protein